MLFSYFERKCGRCFLYWLLPAEEVIVSCGENYSFQPRKQTFLPVENCRLLNNNLLDAVLESFLIVFDDADRAAFGGFFYTFFIIVEVYAFIYT